MIIKKGIIKNDIYDLLNMLIELLITQEYNSKYEIKMIVNKVMMIKEVNMKIMNIIKLKI